MFPIPWNKEYRKKDGTLIKINDAMSGGGGGSDLPPHSSSDAGKVLTVGDDGDLEWHEAGGAGGDVINFKFGNSSAIVKSTTSLQIGPLATYGNDYIIPCSDVGVNIKPDLSAPFEIGCKVKITGTLDNTPRNLFGSINSYYHAPTINISSGKIGYNLSLNGNSWYKDGAPLTPSGWSYTPGSDIIAKIIFDGEDITFYANDGVNEYSETLENTAPFYNADYVFCFGGQYKSQYSIAAVGGVIEFSDTYLKQNNAKIW